jgi:hypothetical protein
MNQPPVTLEPALAHLPARHRRAIGEAIGADGRDTASIAAALRDEARLEQIVRALPDEARVAATELAFQAVDVCSAPGGREISRQAFYELERHGLALCFDSSWATEFVAPLELGALVTERLGPGLLAVPADRLGAVRTAVHRAEIELGPGLDRVSGHWHDPPHDDDEPEWWRPTEDDEERAELPIGRLVSGLELDPDPDWATRQPALGDPPRITIVRDPELDTLLDDDQGLAPEELLLESYEFGTLVELRSAGANGTSTEQVTVAELDDARFLVEDTETGEQRWRWLKAERVPTFRAGVDAAVATRRIRLLG